MRARPLIRALLILTAVLGALGAAGNAVARRRTVGDDESDAFSIAAVFGGVERTCRAPALRSGSALAVCGGVELDLRDATLDPAGAHLRLEAYLGGVEVKVRPEWSVTVARTVVAGGIETQVTPSDELPPDAPSLVVEATAVMGGVVLRAVD